MPYFKTKLPIETRMQALNNVADSSEQKCAIASGRDGFYIATNDIDLTSYMRILKEHYTKLNQEEAQENRRTTLYGVHQLFH